MSENSAGKGGSGGRVFRFLFLLSLVLLVFAAGWALLRKRLDAPNDSKATAASTKPAQGPVSGGGPMGSGLVVEGARISASLKPEAPGPNPLRFHSGEEVFVHLTLDKAGSLFVALLDANLVLSLMSPVSLDGTAGPNVLGPFEVENAVGREALIVIASSRAQTTADFQRLLQRGSDAARGIEPRFEAKLAVVLEALRAHEGITAVPLEFEHVRA